MATAMSSSVMISQRPFVAAKAGAPRRSSCVKAMAVKKSQNEESHGVAKPIIAALAAASIAISGPALAAFDLPGFSVGRDGDADSSARSAMDKSENKGAAVQSRPLDTSGVDGYKTAGTTQADAKLPSVGRQPKEAGGLEPDSPIPTKDQKFPAARGPGVGGAAEAKLDSRAALASANDQGAPVKKTSFTPFDVSALQKNVAFGIGEVGTTSDQAEGRGKELQGNSANPDASPEQAVKKFGKEAKAVLSNPSGPGSTKAAAEKISEANSEIPKALAGDKNAKPVSFNGFDTASLQRTAGLEV